MITYFSLVNTPFWAASGVVEWIDGDQPLANPYGDVPIRDASGQTVANVTFLGAHVVFERGPENYDGSGPIINAWVISAGNVTVEVSSVEPDIQPPITIYEPVYEGGVAVAGLVMFPICTNRTWNKRLASQIPSTLGDPLYWDVTPGYFTIPSPPWR